MVKNYTTPLNVQIINKGKNKNSFVPYKTDEKFPVEVNGKVSFVVNSSEAGLYYEKQARENLIVNIFESDNSTTSTGSYDLSTETFTNNASYNTILESAENNTFTYKVIGTLPYSEATPAIGMPAGNRFETRFAYEGITSKADLPSGKICTVSISDGTTNEYTKSNFENDGSLVNIVNVRNNSTLTVTVDWTDEVTNTYVFTFADVKMAEENEVVENIQNIEIGKDQKVTLENKANRTIGFIPYRENFVVNLAKEDKDILETKSSEEVLYYLLQASDDLKVTL